MSSQLLSSASSSSSSSASSSVSPSPSSSSGGGKWRRKGRSCSRRRKGRAGRRPGTAEGVVKKNAREKERVLVVRREYEILGAELGDLVERGSGHFSKNRTLAAAIHCIDRLEASRHLASGSEEPTASTRSPSPLPDVPVQSPQSSSLPPLQVQIVPATAREASPGINLSCEERLEPAENYTHEEASLEILPGFQEDLVAIPPVLSATPYFSYSSPSDFPPPVIGSYIFPGSSPSLPPPSSCLCSPELTSHVWSSSLPPSSSSLLCSPELAGHVAPTIPLSPPGMSSPQHPYHCGTDIWLAIGCN